METRFKPTLATPKLKKLVSNWISPWESLASINIFLSLHADIFSSWWCQAMQNNQEQGICWNTKHRVDLLTNQHQPRYIWILRNRGYESTPNLGCLYLQIIPPTVLWITCKGSLSLICLNFRRHHFQSRAPSSVSLKVWNLYGWP